MKHVILSFLCFSAFAGQSIQFGSSSIANLNLPTTVKNRVEFYLHDWTSATNGHVLTSGATGWWATFGFSNGVQSIQVFNGWDTGGVVAEIPIGSLQQKGVYVRLQRDPENKQEMVEAWDVKGNRIVGASGNYKSGAPKGNDVTLSWGSEPTRSMGFFRVHTTLVPLNSRPPVTQDTANRLFEWKFDGSLMDVSGNGYPAYLSAGRAVYVPTAYQNVIAILKTANAPGWTNVVTQRAGFPAILDGTSSFSQADGSASVSCFWQELSGPSTVTFSSRTSCSPAVSGLIFGDYLFQLSVSDVAGQRNSVTADVGAVATDHNGVVINQNPNADIIFGPMIAFGKSPWSYMDVRAYCGLLLKAYPGTITQSPDCSGIAGNMDALGGYGPTPPVWSKTGVGTVSYKYAAGLSPQTSLCSDLTATDMSVTVCDASKLDLTSLPGSPVLLQIHQNAPPGELIWFCSVSGNVLRVCYDGRGAISPSLFAAAAWPKGTVVSEYKVTGTGTKFVTDPDTAICPMGAGTPPGTVTMSGKATLTPGSAAVTAASGPAWTQALQTSTFVASSTHGSTPFSFSATIGTFTDATHFTLARPYPADADGGTFTYSILAPSSMVLHINRANPASYGADGMQIWYTGGCGSETTAYLAATHDTSYDNTVQSGVKYGYMPGTNPFPGVGTWDPEFYGESLAHRAMWLRSGLDLAKTAARNIDDWWVRSPGFDSGFAGSGNPLNIGGGILGAVACVATDPGCGLHWSDVRNLGNWAYRGAYKCESDDSRDLGYLGSILGLIGLFDPAPPTPTYWTDKIATQYASDVGCKTPDSSTSGLYFNSWAGTGARLGGFWGPITFTKGSATATYPNLPAGFCEVTASGTGIVSSGSGTFTVVTGNVPPPGATGTLALTGTSGGGASPFVMYLFFTGTGGPGTALTLSGLWAGDSGTVSWMYQPAPNTKWIGRNIPGTGLDNSDPQLKKQWVCSYSGNTITLNTPWDSTSCAANGCLVGNGGGNNGPAGVLQQPFMLSIRGRSYYWNSNFPGPLGAKYRDLANAAATWQHDYGYEPVSQGFYYFRGAGCEPPATPTPGTSFGNTQLDCNSGLDIAGIMAARELTAENIGLVRAYYELNPSPAAKTYGDTAYGALWGNPNYANTGGVYVPPVYNAGSLAVASNAGMGNKWYGFHFGVGMAHQWPAVRLGGVAPLDNRTVYIPFSLSGVPNAAKVQVTLTQPSGLTLPPTVCASSPCAVTVDRRAGSPLMKIDYLNASNAIIAPGDVITLYVP